MVRFLFLGRKKIAVEVGFGFRWSLELQKAVWDFAFFGSKVRKFYEFIVEIITFNVRILVNEICYEDIPSN